MSSQRINPNLIKRHRSYEIGELAVKLKVHKNTVRLWQRDGLSPVNQRRPYLFHGNSVRVFLETRIAARKRPCPPGTLYCFRCREPRQPALGMVDYVGHSPTSGNLSAMCATCGTMMHRRVARSRISAVMPGIAVKFTGGS